MTRTPYHVNETPYLLCLSRCQQDRMHKLFDLPCRYTALNCLTINSMNTRLYIVQEIVAIYTFCQSSKIKCVIIIKIVALFPPNLVGGGMAQVVE